MYGTDYFDRYFLSLPLIVCSRFALDGTIPAISIRDQPDRTFRAVFQDFSGCRVLNTETVSYYC